MSCDKSLVYSLGDISNVVQYLKQQFAVCRIFAFYGPLGAGKTTLARELLRGCGISGVITSPTFTYLNVYKNDQGQKFYHFDLYRLSSLNSFLAAGFDEYLSDQESICLIEWPEVIESLLQQGVCRVSIDYHQDPQKRILNCCVLEK